MLFPFFLMLTGCGKKTGGTEIEFVKPTVKNMSVTVSVSGTVKPKNRLQVQPPLGGRVEKVLVSEGQYVHLGQTLAQMSSGERAAILDTARAQGASNLRYWEQIYKPILIVAPMNGTVIVRNIEPGQTITAADVALVISDKLIVEALVDETDIGQVRTGMKVSISLDAYPDVQIRGTVGHIAYESVVNNNVTMYKVEILPTSVPGFVRSGMSASMEIVITSKEDAVTIPSRALIRNEKGSAVLVNRENGERPEMRPVRTGVSTGSDVEILSGLAADETIVIHRNPGIKRKKTTSKTNPFMPQRPRSSGTRTQQSPPPPPN